MTQDKKLEDFLPNKNVSYYKEFKFQTVVSLISKEKIIECIKTVRDPEIPVNLYDLGLIYSIKNTNNNVIIENSFSVSISKDYQSDIVPSIPIPYTWIVSPPSKDVAPNIMVA